ncbi:MAG: hypothetical protein ACAH12_10720 [Methylophilaceae bacterium]|uniref:hypothetical protein n=1 Tax=Methylovorus sp. MM2 TaxID=1848038 RepID=UPI0007DF7F89|nr:hypothetical protein [Methylovorus sp. MM2]OAM52874.1 hypothetical protein A7981_05390 [Methylovorus sp. MM2]
MKFLPLAAPILLSSLFLFGCSHNSPRYAPSVTNQEKLKNIATQALDKKVATETFTAVSPGRKSIVCRAAGTVTPPDGKSFEKYLEDAFVGELKMSGLYASTGQKISGKLQELDFNSNIGAGKWIIKMEFSCAGKSPFIVESQYDFSTNFIADIACEQVSQALPAATQDFIEKVVDNQGFKNCL